MVRRYRRRYSRRSKLTTKKILTRKSAKSQAQQILALRNSVRRISRSLRPEIRTTYNEFRYEFDNSAFSKTSYGLNIRPEIAGIEGSSVRFKNVIIKGNIEYSDVFLQQVAIDHQRTCTLRILVVQTKVPTDGVDAEDLIDLKDSGVGYELNAYKPLKSGTASNFRVLADRKYTMSDQVPIRTFSINLSRLGQVTYELNSPANTGNLTPQFPQPKGSLHVLLVASGLHWDSNYTQKITINGFYKQAFTDS